MDDHVGHLKNPSNVVSERGMNPKSNRGRITRTHDVNYIPHGARPGVKRDPPGHNGNGLDRPSSERSRMPREWSHYVQEPPDQTFHRWDDHQEDYSSDTYWREQRGGRGRARLLNKQAGPRRVLGQYRPGCSSGFDWEEQKGGRGGGGRYSSKQAGYGPVVGHYGLGTAQYWPSIPFGGYLSHGSAARGRGAAPHDKQSAVGSVPPWHGLDVFHKVFEGMSGTETTITFVDYAGDRNPEQDGEVLKTSRLTNDFFYSTESRDKEVFQQKFVKGVMDVRSRYDKASHGPLKVILNYGHMYVVFKKQKRYPIQLTYAEYESKVVEKPILGKSSFYPAAGTDFLDQSGGLRLIDGNEIYHVTLSRPTRNGKRRDIVLILDENLQLVQIRSNSINWLVIDIKRKSGADIRIKLKSERYYNREEALQARNFLTDIAALPATLEKNGEELQIQCPDPYEVQFVRHKKNRFYDKTLDSSLKQVRLHVRSLTEYSRPEGRHFTSVVEGRNEVSVRVDPDDMTEKSMAELQTYANDLWDCGIMLGDEYYAKLHK